MIFKTSMKRLIFLILFFSSSYLFAQHPSVDSLGRIAKSWAIKKPSFGRDTNLIFALSDYIFYKNYFRDKDTKSLLDSLERLANRTNWKVGKGLVIWNKCNYTINFEQDKGPKAFDLGIKALEIFKKEKNSKALFYGNIRMASLMLNNVNTDEKTKTDGLNYAIQAVAYAKTLKDTSLICHGLAFVAGHLQKFGKEKFDVALEALNEGERYMRKAKVSYFAENLISGTMAALHADKGNKEKSLEYIEKTLATGKRENDLYSLCAMAEFRGYLETLKNIKTAIPYFEVAYGYAKKLEDINVLARIEERLYGSYRMTNDPKKALEYLELFNNHQDKIDKKNVQKIYADYDISNKELKIKALENQELIKEKAIKILENQSLMKDRDSKIKELNFLKILKINEDSLAIKKTEKIISDLKLADNQAKIKSLENDQLKKESEKQNLLRNILLASLLAGLGIVFYIYKNNLNLQSKNLQLINKNNEIEEALLKGTLEERRRVASELHDNLSAKISGIRMRLEAIKPNFNTEKEERIYNSSVNAIAEVYTDVRLISHNLLPAELETKGLSFATEHFINELNSAGKTQFSFENEVIQKRYSNKIEYELFSIILELSNNIMKHSNAENATINLSENNSKLILTVADNGIGIDNEITLKGMGIKNLQSRIDALKGKIHYENTGGLKVEVVVPV
jgi:two-component system, NarL family, sensor kinase